MMAADSLHVVVPLIVPSGMSFQWLPPCRRACSAGAFAPHFALPSAQPSNVQASCLERARPAAFMASVRAFAGALAAPAAAPRPPLPGAPAKGKGGRQDKGHGTRPRRKPVCTWGTQHGGFAAVPRGARGPRQCRHVRVLRATGHAGACGERGHDRPPRRRFPRAPQRPDEPGQGQGQSFVSKVLKQAGKASGGKSAVRRPGTGVNGQRAGQRPGSRLGRGHTVARFAGAKLTSCRGA